MPCDVQNPLLGINGAAYVFGPQKGALQQDLQVLDNNMENIIKLFLQAKLGPAYTEEIFQELANLKGTGAAGGLVASLLAIFEKAQLVNGMDYISELSHLEEKI